MYEAAERLDRGQNGRRLFGDAFVDTFVKACIAEDAALRKAVPDEERRRYLDGLTSDQNHKQDQKTKNGEPSMVDKNTDYHRDIDEGERADLVQRVRKKIDDLAWTISITNTSRSPGA